MTRLGALAIAILFASVSTSALSKEYTLIASGTFDDGSVLSGSIALDSEGNVVGDSISVSGSGIYDQGVAVSLDDFEPNDPVLSIQSSNLTRAYPKLFLNIPSSSLVGYEGGMLNADHGSMYEPYLGSYYDSYDATADAYQEVLLTNGKLSMTPANPISIDTATAERAYNYVVDTVAGAKDAIVKYIQTGNVKPFIDAIGEDVTDDLGSVTARIGGVISNAEVKLLDPDVAKGFKVFYQALTDPNSDTKGLLNGEAQKDQLQKVLTELTNQEGRPIAPANTRGGISTFDVPVTKGAAVTIDPSLAPGFVYRVGSGNPLFSSVTLPTVGEATKYDISALVDDKWVDLGEQEALVEYTFQSPVSAFKVTGIPVEYGGGGGDGNGEWISEVSFDGSGMFTGTLTSLGGEVSAAPEPSEWAMIILGLALVGGALRLSRREPGLTPALATVVQGVPASTAS